MFVYCLGFYFFFKNPHDVYVLENNFIYFFVFILAVAYIKFYVYSLEKLIALDEICITIIIPF